MFEKKNIPNLLTMLRLVLAAVFFVLLAFYQFGNEQVALIISALALFIIAALTDALDGYYARKWQVESKFGRIMDPFCDKVLIIGALCFLAGPGFSTAIVHSPDSFTYEQHSGIYPWMVVVIIARELLVTGIRGEMEGSGHKFGANVWGKIKMILQSIVIPAVLLIVLALETQDGTDMGWLELSRDILVYATVVVTVLSGIPYVTGAYRVSKADQSDNASA